jgi:N-acetylglucosamine transport system permease protein
VYLVFVVWPLIQAFQLSLQRWRGVSATRTFIGFENYRQLFGDTNFHQSIFNNLWLLVVAGFLMLWLGVAIAHAMQSQGKLSRFLRSVYLFPQAISLVVVAILWMFLYNPTYGLINGTLEAVGLAHWERPWLGDRSTALPAVGVAFLWYGLGFYVMLFSAGLQSISR